MPRVIIINEPRPCKFTGRKHFYDVSPAKKFGEIEFLFKQGSKPPSDEPEIALQLAKELLADFTKEDYLVWAGGDPFGLIVASLAVANKKTVSYLKWDRLLDDKGARSSGHYIPLLLENK